MVVVVLVVRPAAVTRAPCLAILKCHFVTVTMRLHKAGRQVTTRKEGAVAQELVAARRRGRWNVQ